MGFEREQGFSFNFIQQELVFAKKNILFLSLISIFADFMTFHTKFVLILPFQKMICLTI
jgi:hypothetical protein